jgi:NAD(P)-dependent dehydrogenase (short-subunit alcohol dehydrogenase family)
MGGSARAFFDIRYWAALAACQYASKTIRSGGSITLTSGAIHKRPIPGGALASSLTGAMEGLTRALGVELAPLRVNIVCPGLVKTPMWDGMSPADREPSTSPPPAVSFCACSPAVRPAR